MIPDDDTIRFSPEDLPEFTELKPVRRPKRRRYTQEPEGWRPIGAEW